MNAKLILLVFIGLLAGVPAFAQTDNGAAAATTNSATAPAGNADTTNAPAATPDTNAVPPATAAAADTNAAPAATAAADTNAAPAATAAAADANAAPAATAAVPATAIVPDANAPAVAPSSASSQGPIPVVVVPVRPGPSEDIIPLIQFQDVQLTTAIENLARQASLNYILDPRLSFNQVDERGQPKPQPSISIRWENVTAAQALNALLSNYGLQLIDDPKTRISRITVRDPAAPDPLTTRVVQLRYAACSNMVVAVQTTFVDKRSKVIGDQRTSQMVVVATEREQANVDALVDKLDKPTRQVLIEAKILETLRNPSTVKGVDWTGTLQAQNFSFGNGVINPANSSSTTVIPGTATSSGTTPIGRALPSSASSAITTISSILSPSSTGGGVTANTMTGLTPAIGFLNADGVSAVLSFLNSQFDTRVISTPRAVTLDNETASLSVITAEPIFNVQASTQTTTGGSSVTYTNLGTILTVTPRISADDHIWLRVVPEVSSLGNLIQKTVLGQVVQADEYDIRRIETQVIVPDGHTLVMGGMLNNNTANSYTKVPVLGDIPILGYAFHHENKSMTKTDLIIFVTPTIVRDEDYQENHSRFLASSPGHERELTRPESFWDSGKPYDWSSKDKIRI